VCLLAYLKMAAALQYEEEEKIGSVSQSVPP
jgi:hypothetical protein